MSIAKIQTGDNVKVIAGANKGLIGQVTKVFRVKKTNIIKTKAFLNVLPKLVKYQKAMKSYNAPGQMLSVDRPIDISNLALISTDGQVSKIRIETDSNGKKQRILKKTNQPVPANSLKSKTETKNDDLSAKDVLPLPEPVKSKKTKSKE